MRGGGPPLLPTTSYTYEIIYYLDGELSGAGIESPRPWWSGGRGERPGGEGAARRQEEEEGSVRDGTRYT